MTVRIVLILCFIATNLKAQNLVPNPGFELYSRCPDGMKQLDRSLNWSQANAGSPEYFHSCGFTMDKEAAAGSAMAGAIFLDRIRSGVEYLQVKLKDSLKSKTTYCFSALFSPSEKNAVMINRIGASLTKQPLQTPNWEPFIRQPQIYSEELFADPDNWTELSGEFEAKGGEAYLTLGNFFESWFITEQLNPSGNSSYSYYYVDEVYLWPKQLTCDVKPQLTYSPPVASDMRREHIVYFDKDDFRINAQEAEKLMAFVKQLMEYNPQEVKIEGHTDSDASLEYNVDLSRRRTESVDQFIQQVYPVSTYLLWEGEQKPLNLNLSKQEKAMNRRVVIKVY